MRRLVVLNLLKKNKTESGFNLIEMLVVTAIIGIMSAVAVPNLLGSQRDNQAKEAFTKIRSALIETQTTANRISEDCTMTVTESTNKYSITGSTYTYPFDHDNNPSTPTVTRTGSCITEPFTIDKSVAILETSDSSASSPLSIDIQYDFEGDTGDSQTLLISRNNSGSAMRDTGRCIVISSNLGMIRTGTYDKDAPSTGDFTSDDCNNTENDRYDKRPK